jgi:hypothetical protein
MLGKLSIIGAVAAILMIPTALSAQMGGAINPGVHVGGTVNPGATVRGAVERGIPGPDLGTWRSPTGKFTASVSILLQGSADEGLTAMDKLLFWLGIGAAQKGAGSKPIERRNWVVSLVVGVLVAAVMIVGMFLLFVSQKL